MYLVDKQLSSRRKQVTGISAWVLYLSDIRSPNVYHWKVFTRQFTIEISEKTQWWCSTAVISRNPWPSLIVAISVLAHREAERYFALQCSVIATDPKYATGISLEPNAALLKAAEISVSIISFTPNTEIIIIIIIIIIVQFFYSATSTVIAQSAYRDER